MDVWSIYFVFNIRIADSHILLRSHSPWWSQAIDVYAAGVLMWEIFHGCRAWAGMSQIQARFTLQVVVHRNDRQSICGHACLHMHSYTLSVLGRIVVT